MNIGDNIKRIREEKGLKQQQIADLVSMHRSNYSKVENGQRELSVTALSKVAHYFGITLDQLVNMDDLVPQEVTIVDKTANEKLRLIEQLDEEDKQAVYRIIDGMLTKTKFKDFFAKNV
jgi:transcriptional regulator with XRE-family HTH domain